MNTKRIIVLLAVFALLLALPLFATMAARLQAQGATGLLPERDIAAEKRAIDGRSPLPPTGPEPLAPDEDPFEPNNRIPRATAVAYGDTIDASINPAGDEDFFKFEGQAGDTVSVRIVAFAVGSFLDAIVTLIGPDGRTVVARNDDFVFFDSFLSHVLPVDGTYYLKVEDFGFPDGGPEYFYSLNLDKVVYVSAKMNGSVDGLSFSNGDILAYHEGSGHWEILVDMSDLGINKNLSAFDISSEFGCILLSFSSNVRFPGFFTAKPQDITAFCPFILGEDTGGFIFPFLEGRFAGLNTKSEAIDAIEITPDFRLLLSTTGSFAVPTFAGPYPGGDDLTGQDEDLLAFDGSFWQIYLDGSDVPGLGSEDITGLALNDANGDLYLTLEKNFNVGGVAGNNNDVIIVRSLGAGVFATDFFWDAGSVGLNEALDGVSLGP